ncbi:hypothetical protein [Streptomyces sp. A5-4]|uniref:hypothetical protein n=1 Tax=Streptomyces sp. A5-4 TaxID=3384771 RepID=UPI003DA8DB80
MCAVQGLAGPQLNQDQLRVWETRPEHRRQPATIDPLCRLYQANARELDLATAGITGPTRFTSKLPP